MSRPILVTVLVLAAAIALGSTALAQSFEFKLGFKALAEQVPEVVGQPLENEHWGDNGDSLQRTTNGLMAWRKADNWTAFTNGSRTWINGPSGVQDRPNDERFDWEAPEPPAAPTPRPLPMPTQVTLTRYSPEVRAMDEQSAAHGVMVTTFMQEVESEWANAWQWRPTKPLTIYLFMDGNRLAEAFAAARARPLSETEKTNLPMSGLAWGSDSQTRGWAIMINLGRGYGNSNWGDTVKANLAKAYSDIMLGDLVGFRSPKWFRNGFVDLITFSKSPGNTTDDFRGRLLTRYRDAGRLPTLRYMHENFDSMVAAGGETATLAWGMGDLAVSFLADRVGGSGIMEIEKRLGTGDRFESALQAVAGYTLERLDVEYRVKIPQ